jgi:uncharacterized membrane protein YkvA (DUF1232 family)
MPLLLSIAHHACKFQPPFKFPASAAYDGYWQKTVFILQYQEVLMLYRWLRFFRKLGRETIVLWYACRNPATPKKIKAGALLLGLYLLSPIDLIPDFILLFGWLDDVAILAFLLPLLLRRVPQPALMQANIAADRCLSKWRAGLRKH